MPSLKTEHSFWDEWNILWMLPDIQFHNDAHTFNSWTASIITNLLQKNHLILWNGHLDSKKIFLIPLLQSLVQFWSMTAAVKGSSELWLQRACQVSEQIQHKGYSSLLFTQTGSTGKRDLVPYFYIVVMMLKILKIALGFVMI